MSIVASVIVEDRVQKDGRRSIRERHTDHVGGVYDFIYLAESGADVSAMMTARVASLELQLSDNEVRINEQRAYDQLSLIIVHSTVAANRAWLRERFRNLTSWQAVRLGKFISSLNLTDTQLKNLFGVNDAQLPALKTKLSNLASKYDGVETGA